ncbi:helicase-related protein [Acidipropionibacterium acidipropionici]|uniref:helicase-related protein n=2 Tax=Bacillati TaxID=1783272 RepID=UPI001F17534A|nr:helicase-related protein [Acidipropionibacterium acidipropionici]
MSSVVGGEWAERLPPHNELVEASPQEDAVATELADTWLHPVGANPYSGQNASLFPWTLAKAFLSSPAALKDSIGNRLDHLNPAIPAQRREADALTTLEDLNDATFAHSAKYDALLTYLKDHVHIGSRSPERAVVFSERVPTLHWLQEKLAHDLHLRLGDQNRLGQVEILHGGMTDVDQQRIVESFKQSNSPIRVLVTGDVASEGVNLHLQCHELIHYDIPWSLIRIEQRNGRIDRYGQRHRPQITTLLLEPSTESWRGDVGVLSKLLTKEEAAHTALGDAASLMGEYSATAEENAIRDVLAHRRNFDDVVKDPEEVVANPGDFLTALLNQVGAADAAPATPETPTDPLYRSDVDFLREAVEDLYEGHQAHSPADNNAGGIAWREFPDEHLVEFTPPADLKTRLEVLPDTYLNDRKVLTDIKLATTAPQANRLLRNALNDANGSSWPEAHYLGPLHPVLDWAADRCLAALSRNEIFAVRGDVDAPTVLLVGTVTNKRGQVISAVWMSVPHDPDDPFAMMAAHESSADMLRSVGFGPGLNNPGPVADVDSLQSLIPDAVEQAKGYLAQVSKATMDAA